MDDASPTAEAPGLDLALPPAEHYRVLARKYRPSDFSGLIGQDALVRTLKNAFASGRIAHAFMLTGVRGVGKTTTARVVARALNCIGVDGSCQTPTIQPCGQCQSCRAISESRHVDVQEMDAASRTGIDDIREIIEGVRYAPATARYKVYIIDEVHMLSKQAFNGLLKTLEEPPPHVKFIFATTEIRKVPVTVLSRCQRFDLRRIEPEVLISHLRTIADKEQVPIADDALALIARAAEGSVRDALSLLDQAIAHGEGQLIAAQSVRTMLGLADHGRILDLFEALMGGHIETALRELEGLHGHGADPLQVMQDLMELTHFLTRLKVAPAAEGFFDGSSGEARRAAQLAAGLSVPTLTRTWQLLLKGLLEVRDASRPLAACEMALIRLAYAADLPPTDRLVREVMENMSARPAAPTAAAPSAPGATARGRSDARVPLLAQQMVPQAQDDAAPSLRTLEDVVALATARGAAVLKVHLENDVHLVTLEPGRLEFRPGPRAPRTLAQDLAQKLKDWTGQRWVVSLAREGGAPSIAEARKAKITARLERVLAEPMVRAVLDRFPGAEVIRVIDKEPLLAADGETGEGDE